MAYPDFQIRLPGKRWFKDNFDPGIYFFIR